MTFIVGQRVRIREGVKVAVQPGVGPGSEGVVQDDKGQNPRTVQATGAPGQDIYVVLFEGMNSPDLVEQSALEAAD